LQNACASTSSFINLLNHAGRTAWTHSRTNLAHARARVTLARATSFASRLSHVTTRQPFECLEGEPTGAGLLALWHCASTCPAVSSTATPCRNSDTPSGQSKTRKSMQLELPQLPVRAPGARRLLMQHQQLQVPAPVVQSDQQRKVLRLSTAWVHLWWRVTSCWTAVVGATWSTPTPRGCTWCVRAHLPTTMTEDAARDRDTRP
jgi:hypothetical protein